MHVICLSVCHIRAPCLNCSTNLDANWQVHCTMTHCVRWGPYPPRKKGKFGCQTPSRNVQFAGPMLPAGQYKRGPIPPFAKLHWSSLLLLPWKCAYVRPSVCPSVTQWIIKLWVKLYFDDCIVRACLRHCFERVEQASVEQNIAVREPVEHAVGKPLRRVEEHILEERQSSARSARHL